MGDPISTFQAVVLGLLPGLVSGTAMILHTTLGDP
jgi:hypothetical protein